MKNTFYIMSLGLFLLFACNNATDEQTQEKKSETIDNKPSSKCDCAKWLADELKLAIEKSEGDVIKFDTTYGEFIQKMEDNQECEKIMEEASEESSLEEFVDNCPEMQDFLNLQESLKSLFSESDSE